MHRPQSYYQFLALALHRQQITRARTPTALRSDVERIVSAASKLFAVADPPALHLRAQLTLYRL